MEIGKKYLITTQAWFLAPDGAQYRAVYGTVKALCSDAETLGIKTNARSTNWYITIGNMVVAGCQVFYAIETDKCELSIGQTWETDAASGALHRHSTPSIIYNADAQ